MDGAQQRRDQGGRRRRGAAVADGDEDRVRSAAQPPQARERQPLVELAWSAEAVNHAMDIAVYPTARAQLVAHIPASGSRAQVWLCGVSDAPGRARVDPGTAVAAVCLAPWALAGLGVSARELARRVVPVESLDIDTSVGLADLPRRLSGRGGASAVAELLAVLPRVVIVPPVVPWLAGRLDGDGDGLARAAEQSGHSVRYLERAFRRYVGLPPGRYRGVRRVVRAIGHIEDGRSLAEAAQLAGYCDQSHLSRAFRRVVGTTPGRYRPTDVANVQSHGGAFG